MIKYGVERGMLTHDFPFENNEKIESLMIALN